MSEKVEVVFGSNVQAALDGINNVSGKFDALGSRVEMISSTMQKLGSAMAGAFAIREIGEFVEKITELGEHAEITASMLGLTVSEVQDLEFAAKIAIGSADGMGMAIGRFEKNITTAIGAAGEARDNFAHLGITLQDLKTKTPSALLLDVADAFEKSQDGATKYGYAVELGGRSWGRMIPLLNQGRSGLQGLNKEFEDTGAKLSDLDAHGFAQTNDRLDVFKVSVEGTGVQLMRVFRPAIDFVLLGLTGLIQSLNFVIGLFGDLTEALQRGVVRAFLKITHDVMEFGTVTGAVLDRAIALWETLGEVISKVKDGNFAGAKQAVVDLGEEMKKINEKEKQDLIALQKEYDALIVKLYNVKVAKGGSGELPPLAQTGTGSKGLSKADEEFMRRVKENMKDIEMMEKINKKTTENMQKPWRTMFQSIGSGFKSVIQGVLMGTQTIKQAFANLAISMVTSFVGSLADIAMAWLENKIFGDAITKAQGMTVIGTHAAEGSAAAYASTAAIPVVGPALAPAAAAQAYGSIMAMNAMIPAYESGSWQIPRTGLANIHEDEMIIPAGPARMIRDGLSQGGSSGGKSGDTFHIHATDAQSFARMMESPAGQAVIVKSMSKAKRNFNAKMKDTW
jgi:hypothetical protein